MYELPISVTVNDTEYKITNAGDFRMVLDCFSALNDIEMGEDFRILASLLIFYEDFNDIEDVENVPEDDLTQLIREMMLFFNCGQPDDDNVNLPKLIDWDNDSMMIIAAVNNVAGKEVRAEQYIHWWTFVGYYMSVGESVLSTVVGIRDKIVKGKKLDKWEKDYKAEHPKYFNWNSKSVEEQELDNLVHELWNK